MNFFKKKKKKRLKTGVKIWRRFQSWTKHISSSKEYNLKGNVLNHSLVSGKREGRRRGSEGAERVEEVPGGAEQPQACQTLLSSGKGWLCCVCSLQRKTETILDSKLGPSALAWMDGSASYFPTLVALLQPAGQLLISQKVLSAWGLFLHLLFTVLESLCFQILA